MSRRVYLDPNSGVVYDLASTDHEGWLTKRSRWLHDWRRRYFIVKDDKLFYSQSETKEPHGMIDLSKCMTVKSAELKTRMRNSIEVATPGERYYLYADTSEEKDMWIGLIGRAIVRSSGTFTADDGMEYDSQDDGEGDDEAPYY